MRHEIFISSSPYPGQQVSMTFTKFWRKNRHRGRKWVKPFLIRSLVKFKANQCASGLWLLKYHEDLGLCWSFERADTAFSTGYRLKWVRGRLRGVFEASSTAWLNTGLGLSSEKAEQAVSKFSIHREEFYQNLDQQWQPSVTTGIKKYSDWWNLEQSWSTAADEIQNS